MHNDINENADLLACLKALSNAFCMCVRTLAQGVGLIEDGQDGIGEISTYHLKVGWRYQDNSGDNGITKWVVMLSSPVQICLCSSMMSPCSPSQMMRNLLIN